MTLEEKARQEIDRKLENAGWQVCNRDEFSPAISALAVREVIMQGGLEADYLLFIREKRCLLAWIFLCLCYLKLAHHQSLQNRTRPN